MIQLKKKEPQLEGIELSFNLGEVKGERKLEMKLLRRRTADKTVLRVIFPEKTSKAGSMIRIKQELFIKE